MTGIGASQKEKDQRRPFTTHGALVYMWRDASVRIIKFPVLENTKRGHNEIKQDGNV